MITAALLFFFGLGLSAFFSGAETGLYRVSRTRLVLDGLSGSLSAKGMVWLLNRPAIFVATTLVGNNVANFITSFSLVLGVAQLFSGSAVAELLGPILMTPIVFVFGELLPKHLFYQAPYRLLSKAKPFLFFATVLFLPISLLLSVLGVVLRRVTGQTPFRLRLAMTRGELDQVMQAGQEAGILQAGQRELAQQLFEVGNQSAAAFGVPPGRLPTVDLRLNQSVKVSAAIHQARRRKHPIVLVRRDGRVIGYFRYSELIGQDSEMELSSLIKVDSLGSTDDRISERIQLREVVSGRVNERHLSLLLRMYDVGSEVALLASDSGETRFCVTRRQLLQPLTKSGH